MLLTIWIIFVICLCIFSLLSAAGAFKTSISIEEIEGTRRAVKEN